MHTTRIFVDSPLTGEQRLVLPDEAAHHIRKVLRLRIGQTLRIFNGTGGSYQAEIISIRRQKVEVFINRFNTEERESILQVTLLQGISRGRHMDYTLQKAVELGVVQVVPLITEFSNVHLSGDRMHKRLSHWRNIIINACEQCGRNRLPELLPPCHYLDWIARDPNPFKLVLEPSAQQRLSDFSPDTTEFSILSGPEGGLSASEVRQAVANGYSAVQLGPRILRTETAAVVAISACQSFWGDIA